MGRLRAERAVLVLVYDVHGLSQQLLGVLETPLRASHAGERGAGRSHRAHVLRADRVERRLGVTLGFVHLALFEQDLGEPTLGLAQSAAVLQRRERPDRVAAQALSAVEITLMPGDDG